MDIIIRINVDNDMFGESPAIEVSRVLRNLSDHLHENNHATRPQFRAWNHGTPLYDANGNRIGIVKVTR